MAILLILSFNRADIFINGGQVISENYIGIRAFGGSGLTDVTNVTMNGGYIYAQAEDQWLLGERLDQLVLMILDFGLNSVAGKTISICNTEFFLN